MKFEKFLTPISIIIAGGLVAVSVLLVGGFEFGKSQSVRTGTLGAETQVPQEPSVPPPITGPQKVSVDDDPVLGDANAPITLIEFSDYECPFCKRHFEDTLPQIIEEYVNSGAVKIVFRDLPLPFHDPLATESALAANCAREQGGDFAYFNYHDEIFKRTESNGSGLDAPDDLYEISSDLGLNSDQFKTCLDSEKFKDEVEADVADANAAGATGTPVFFIGKSSEDGIIEGTKIVGAQPFSSFKTQIDSLLSE